MGGLFLSSIWWWHSSMRHVLKPWGGTFQFVDWKEKESRSKTYIEETVRHWIWYDPDMMEAQPFTFKITDMFKDCLSRGTANTEELRQSWTSSQSIWTIASQDCEFREHVGRGRKGRGWKKSSKYWRRMGCAVQWKHWSRTLTMRQNLMKLCPAFQLQLESVEHREWKKLHN